MGACICHGCQQPGLIRNFKLETRRRDDFITIRFQRREALEDILVLHLENGKDFFLSVQGQYLPTSFGCLLDHLVRIPQVQFLF
jgi:phosphatidylinositol-bisphosphatase